MQIEIAANQHLFVIASGQRLVGGNEARAHVGKVGTRRSGPPQGGSIGHASCQHDRPVEESSDRSHESEAVEPPRLPTRAGAQEHQPVGPGFHGFARMGQCPDIR